MFLIVSRIPQFSTRPVCIFYNCAANRCVTVLDVPHCAPLLYSFAYEALMANWMNILVANLDLVVPP